MLTDTPPRKANLSAFSESDRIKTLDLPLDRALLTITTSLEQTMKGGTASDIHRVCADYLLAASLFYKVPVCGIRVLAARPLRVREHSATELFGDYNPETMLIRIWMRTAVRKRSPLSAHS
jgi:hypothetical protein